MAEVASSKEDEEEDLSGFREETEVEEKKSNKGTICKAVLRFIFSWLGLALLLAAYTSAGAYYFYKQEEPLETQNREIAKNKAMDIEDAMVYITKRMRYISYGDHITGYGKFNNCSVWIQDPFYVADQGLYGEACLDKSEDAVKNSDFCKCLWNYKDRYENEASKNLYRFAAYIVTSMQETGYNQNSTNHFYWEPKWTFLNSLLFTMTTLTLIGYGHVSPSTDSLRIQVMVYTIIGIPLMALFLANIGSALGDILTKTYSRICCRWCRIRRKRTEGHNPPSLKEDGVPYEEYMPTESVLFPVVATLMLMGMYVMVGAFIYVQWEDWTLLDSAYFTFITLTTIGFGDLVPGSKAELNHEEELSLYGKLVFTSLYCLLGLALIALGIDIIQAHAKAKTKWMRKEHEGMEVYILTKHPDTRETPANKTGNKNSFGLDDSDDDDEEKEEEVAIVEEVETLEEDPDEEKEEENEEEKQEDCDDNEEAAEEGGEDEEEQLIL